MTQNERRKELRRRQLAAKQALLDSQPEKMPLGAKIATALNMGGEALTFGLVGDEAAAAFDDLIGRGDYQERLDLYRGNEEQFREENPVAAVVSQVAPSMVLPGLGVAKASGPLAKAGVGALSGGLGGGIFGYMEGDDGDRARSALTGGLLGAGLGAAAPTAGRLLGDAVDKVRAGSAVRRASRNAPTRDQLEAQASALFTKNKAAQLPRQPLQAASSRIAANGREMGMDAMLTPNAARVAGNIDDAANVANPSMTMQELNVLRRQAQIPAGNVANRPEKAIGTQMIQAIDDYVDSVAPQLGAEGREARKMWSTLRKMDAMDELVERAEQAASGFENGLKAEFRRILKSEKLRRGYSQAELAAMKKVTNPGVLAGIIRQAGRLGVSLDNGSNALGGALGAGLGGSLLGPTAAVVTPLVGTAARKASEVMTQRAASRVNDVIRAQTTTVPALTNQTRGLLDDYLVRAARAAGQQNSGSQAR